MSTFKELQDAVLENRFKPPERPLAKAWINARAQRVWNSTRWSFAVSDLLALNVVAGQETLAIPASLRVVEHVFDERGAEMTKVTLPELYDSYRSDQVQGRTARPQVFAVRNRSIVLAPTPEANQAFTCNGLLVWGHGDGTGAFAAGDMTGDSHKPYWPANHHYLLVPAAKALGTRLRNDPTFPPLEQEFESLYEAMVEELAEDHAVSSYGQRDRL